MDYVKENLIVYSLRSRLEFIQSFGVEPDMFKEWVSMFLFKFVVEHTAKFDFATIDCTFGMVVARLIPGYSDLDDEDEELSRHEIDPFYLPYDDLDVDYTSNTVDCNDVTIPTDEVYNLVSNASYIPEGVSWGDVTDTSFEDHMETIQDIPTLNVESPSVSHVEFMTDDDGLIQDHRWIDANESIAPDITADADLRLCGHVEYCSGSIGVSKWKPKVTQVRPDPSVIQNAVDELFPNHHSVDDKFFQEWVETHDIDLEVTNCDLDLSVFNDWTKGSDTRLMPTLSVGGLSHRVPTQRETLLAVKKRNMNVPELQSQFDHNDVLNRCVNRFMTHVIDKTRLSKLLPISGEEVHYFNQYIENKNPPLSEYKGPIPLIALDKYMHMIKTTLKPVEDDSLHIERLIPATITYHKKGVVMMTSPYFLCAMVRLLHVLKSKFTVPTGKYHQIFQMDPTKLEVSNFFKEIDFSKFDKSQGRLHHDVQFKLFLMLGIPEHFVTTWFNAHEVSHIRDRDCGVGFSVDYQRRTGDACTYLGNTLVTLSVLSYVYDLSSPNILFVAASGDDSLIGSTQPLPRDKEDLCVSLFNFETKFPHNQPFICSKFLLVVECDDGSKEVLAVPNPLKLLQKLGPKTLQVTMIDDYYQSLCDILWVFEDADICRRVAELAEFRCFKGRRHCLFLESALLSLPSLVANRLKFLRRTINLESSKACIRNDVHSNLVAALEPMCARGLDTPPRDSGKFARRKDFQVDKGNSRDYSWREEPSTGDKVKTPRIGEGIHRRGRRGSNAISQRNQVGRKESTWKGGNKLH
ncbi:RdRp [Strawberry necrotic shock virus]|uniref:RNA-directed RNA polymerase 2a n=1 Tax=Strawberry necrotic shock virus TaxID=243563 RepID=Q5XPM6_9BROM|nr:RdRp [Strawberry necrotic shock virus]AAU95676.2 RdRp [Strawberry necrotic shock virus]